MHWVVQTTSSRLTPMNNMRKKNQFSSPHCSMTMISYVQSFIYTYTLIYRKYHTTSAFCLWFVTHYYFSLSDFFFSFSSPLSLFSFTLCHCTGNCLTLTTIAVHNSTYPVLVVTIASTWTHVRRYFFSSIFFCTSHSHPSLRVNVFIKHHSVVKPTIVGNWSLNVDPRPSKRKAGNEEKNIPTTITTNTNKNNHIKQIEEEDWF
jgi:hypothetical protein